MLKHFEVVNFRGFESRLVFDLSARDYAFNKGIVKDSIVNKALIYGKNGTGKSNLGFALFDIIFHLTDKEKLNPAYAVYYRNLNGIGKPVEFRYEFSFDNDEVIYEYSKVDQNELIEESLIINGKRVIFFNYFHRDNNFIDSNIRGELNIDLIDNKLSIIKYIYRNTPSDRCVPLTKMMRFCDNMLWYRSLSEGNHYAGYTNGAGLLTGKIYETGKTQAFEKFLRENGIDYKLGFEIENGEKVLYVYFPEGSKAPFASIASTGTKALLLFYYWSIEAFQNISLLFIDEFDAFFHYESAEDLVTKLNNNRGFQTILTTHNTYLMKNSLTRPDCCFILNDGKIKSLFNCTDREIREAHNLEKMYINGAFAE